MVDGKIVFMAIRCLNTGNMESPSLLVLLITTDAQIAAEVELLLKQPAPFVNQTFVLKTAVSLPHARKIEADPDVIILKASHENTITAVANQFSATPVILLIEDIDEQVDPITELTYVIDVLPQEHLNTSLLQRALSHASQIWQYEYVRNLARKHRRVAEDLIEAGLKMNAIHDYESLLDGILHFVAKFFPFDMASIMLVEGEDVRIERICTADGDDSLQWAIQKATNIKFSLAETRNLREIVDNGRYLIIPDIDEYPDWVHVPGHIRCASWMGAPLLVQEQLLGILTLDSIQPHVYQEEDGPILELFATQAALALRNAHIHRRRFREIAELSALHAIAQASTEANTVDELLTRCTQIVAKELYPDSFGFILVNDDGETMSAHHAVHNRLPVLHPEKLPVGTGVVGQVIQTGEMRRVSDVRTEADYKDIVVHTHSEICVPLKVGGQIIGAINAESILFEAFDGADERFMVALSQQLSTGIERIQLLAGERRNRKEADKLRDAVSSLSTSLDLEQVFNNILSALEEVVPHDGASVMLVQGESLVIVASHGFADAHTLVGEKLSVSGSLFEEVQQTKRPLYLTNVQKDSRFVILQNNMDIKSWICLPLVVHDQVLGALTIDSNQEGVYGAIEVQLAQAFANQAAIAIENARLYTAEQKARNRAEILREASSLMVNAPDLDTILNILLEYIRKLVPYDSASILFAQGDFAQIYLAKGIEKWTDATTLKQLRLNMKTNALFQQAIHTQKGMVIADVHQDERWQPHDETAYVRSWMGIPIMASGQYLGSFSIEKATPGFFTEEHLALVENFTQQTAVLVQNVQLFEETRRRTEELELLTTLSADLQETTELEPMLQIVLEKVLPLVNANFGMLYLIESQTDELVVRYTQPYIPELIGTRQSIHKGISGLIARTGKIYISPDVKHDPLLYTFSDSFGWVDKFHVQTGIGLPLQTQEKIIGVLHVSHDYQHVFSDLEIQLLTAVSEIAGTAIDRAVVLDTLEQRVALRTQELAQANERLTELDKLKTKFISDISHELRTPITNLSLYIDLFERGRPERREQYLSVLRHQIDRLVSMIEDILNISRLDMGRIELTLAPVDLNPLMLQVVASFEDRVNESISLIGQPNEELPVVMGDTQRLMQILELILNNAVEYTQEGRILVQASWEQSKNRVCLEVVDTGVGIPPDELPHIFERFYRGSNVSQSTIAGTGLGLPLAKQLMNLHHGEIEVDSQLGKGTTVRLCFPIALKVLPSA